MRGDEALLLQRDAAPRVSGRGRAEVPVTQARVPEPVLRPRQGRGKLHALPRRVRAGRPGGISRAHDQRAPLDAFLRGVGIEQWWANANPVHNRERFEECHDLILKCWTEPGPFRWEGRHYHFRHVNPWCLPLQRPHPPIWIPGTASPETAIWAGQRGYTYVPFLVPFDIARELFDYYRQGAAEV